MDTEGSVCLLCYPPAAGKLGIKRDEDLGRGVHELVIDLRDRVARKNRYRAGTRGPVTIRTRDELARHNTAKLRNSLLHIDAEIREE